MKIQQSNIRIICFLNLGNFYYYIDKLKTIMFSILIISLIKLMKIVEKR